MGARSVEQADRLDKVLAGWSDVGSRRRAREAIETGKVLVDGRVCREAGVKLQVGQQVEIRWNKPGTSKARQRARDELREAGLSIVFSDEHMVAVDKPPGLLTDTASREQHRTRDSAWKRLRAWLRPFGDRPRTVHRIDRDTSGVVLFARTDHAERQLRDQFRAWQPERVYLALVHGAVRADAETWEDLTRWNSGARLLVRLPPDAEGGKPTVSHVQVRRRFARQATELQVQLHTGRRNQIRLQAAERGHPLVGERLYGQSPRTPYAPRQLLHASRLTVSHPATGEPITLEAPLPADYKTVVRALRKQERGER